MTPDLLAHLTPEQRAAWERCQKAKATMWGRSVVQMEALQSYSRDLPAALLELAQAKRELAGLRAAVDAAPHEYYCINAGSSCTKCNCWKSRVPKC
jgi:hypothetical protein